MSLGIFEIKRFSVDELLKSKPEKLAFLEPIENELDNFTLDVNRVTIHDVRDHKLLYGEHYVIVAFLNKQGRRLASLSAFGSNEDKEDEGFIVGFGSIISETSFRVMKGEIEKE